MFSLKTEANCKIHYLRDCFLFSIHIIYFRHSEMLTHYFWNLDSCSSFCLDTNNVHPQKTAWWMNQSFSVKFFYWKYSFLQMLGRNQNWYYTNQGLKFENIKVSLFFLTPLTPATDLLKPELEILWRIMLFLENVTLSSTGIDGNS